jgi:vacuolar-type H+-ATPase subunit D/Vma8
LAAQLAATRAELATLQKRYDALHADRDRLVQTLETNLKTYKRFRRWMVIEKERLQSKAVHVADPEVKCASDSTPVPPPPPVVKMLETPETPMSLYFFVL